MYFQHFPNTFFLLSPPGYKKSAQYISLVDITTNIRFKKEVIDNIVFYDWYHVKDGDTPEIVSENLYDSPHYNWVIMILNNIYDYRNDWVIDSYSFDKYIIEKYGSIEEAQGMINHYVDSRGLIVDSNNVSTTGIFDAVPVYAYEYEHLLNESKRQIKVLSKNMLTKVLKNFKDLMV